MVLNSDVIDLSDWIVFKLINSFLEPFVMVFKKSVLYSLLLDITIKGEEITDSKQLATKYIKGRFFLDLMSSLPFEKLSLLFYSDKNRQAS